METCLEGEQPFSASSSIAVMVGSEGQGDRKAKGDYQTTCKRPETGPRGYPGASSRLLYSFNSHLRGNRVGDRWQEEE